MNEEDVHYQRIPASDVPEQLLEECARLFSEHYGVWSCSHSDTTKAGQPIRLSGKRVKAYVTGNDAFIATARIKEMLLGMRFLSEFHHHREL